MQETTEILRSILSDPLTEALSTSIYQTSPFAQEALVVNKEFDYNRSNNPTHKVLEDTIARLENGASGFATVGAVVKTCQSGDEIVAVDDIYGGIFRAFEKSYKKFGITVSFVSTTKPEDVLNAITPNTKSIWLETPTNPTADEIKFIENAAGSILGSQYSWLTTREIQTLNLRMGEQCRNAEMTHKGTPDDIRRATGINDSLVRLSVRTEDSADLIDDLEAALKK